MEKYTYLILAFICFSGWIILDNIYSQLKWIALGIGIVMLISAFLPRANSKGEDDDDTEVEDEADVEGEVVSTGQSEEEIEMNLAMDEMKGDNLDFVDLPFKETNNQDQL